jgi:diphosphomevalonate decarboxylase
VSAVTAEARTNIALVKYWGKRDAALNLPVAGSLSLTLDGLTTVTTMTLDASLAADELALDGQPQSGEPLYRVARFLDLCRARAGVGPHARVQSQNSFPTASGLASSASGFAALAVAAAAAYRLDLDPTALSALARRGSGSAARSIFGGFAELLPGGDAHAVPLPAFDVRLVVAVVGGGAPKSVSSRSGMDHTALTSPLFAGFVATVPADLDEARAAITRRDLAALGEVAERSALTMHASALAARPGIVYWRGATVEGIHAVRDLRAAGVAAWVTIDAGPHVKVLTSPADAPHVAQALAAVPGVSRTIIAAPGAGARIVL